MRTRRVSRSICTWNVLALLAMLGGSSCHHARSELRYDGKPLGKWARDLGDRKELRREPAVYALAKSGEDGVAFAVAALDDPDWLTRHTALRAVYFLSGAGPEPCVSGIARCLKDPDPRVREEAAQWLRRIVTSATEARSRKGSEDAAAEGPSDSMGNDSFPLADRDAALAALQLVLPGLEHADPGVRESTARVLSVYGSEAAVASPALERLLGDSSYTVQLAAAVALARCGTEVARTKVPLPLLLEALSVEKMEELDAGLACELPLALAALGPRAKAAVPLLARVLDYSAWYDESLRLNTVEALGQLGPLAGEAIPALEKAAATYGGKVETAAKEALEKIRGN